jgi:quinol-cytochrome oxidoreductase complex cytochrome b subunit
MKKQLDKLTRFAQFDTAGWIAVSSLLLCALSGALLAIPYDFTKPYQSVFEMLLVNPAGSFVRNFHYWSAQLFFIFALLHVYDHLSKSTETNIKSRRTWMILTLVLVVLGYEMISGFILKADAAGLQARRIVASLLESIPFVGRMVGSAFTGSEEHWSIVYVQHIATGTIFLFLAIFSHVRAIWPRLRSLVITLSIIFVISLLFRAPLGLAESSELKGPWFFVGFQELLHQTSHPGYLIWLMLSLLLLFFLLPWIKVSYRKLAKRLFMAFSVFYFLITMMVLLFRGENWQWRGLKDFSLAGEKLLILDPVNLFGESNQTVIPENQKPEGCLLCHGAMTGLSESHNPATIGCFACHKGDPFTGDKKVAHANMVKVPGDFSNVRQTCGTQGCHSEIADRMLNSLMTTQSGIIAVDKFVFGESASLNDTFHVKNLAHSASDTHLRNLCAGCHLGSEKGKTGNPAWLERGGGCNACHLHYSDQATATMNRLQSKETSKVQEVHPAIDLQVSNDRCKSCHSRSGRISLNYEGWNETELKATDIRVSDSIKVLPDDRVVRFVQADIHHKKGMACIDCHTSYEIMGDGKGRAHKEEAVNVQCVDCHPVGKPKSAVLGTLPDRDSQMIAWLRKYNPKSRVVVTAKGNTALLNTTVDSLGNILLTDKLKGLQRLSKPALPVCSRGEGHKRLSCGSCHSAWVPQCIGCHNSYEKSTAGFDLLTGKPTTGSWVEFAGKTLAEPPVLGVSEKSESRIVTTMPGMIMTIDRESFAKVGGNSFHRLYAPASAHTTQREGRSCKSCHNDPLAIGFGRGKLDFEAGKWKFEPRFEPNKMDGLPEDAWTGFLQEAKQPNSTRSDLRPFTVKEQKRILQVGSCLTCHDEKSKVMAQALENFELTKSKRSTKCESMP